MPFTSRSYIVFSPAWVGVAHERKHRAFEQLEGYLRQQGVIVSESDVSFGEIAKGLFHKDLDLTDHFQSGVLNVSLEQSQQKDIAAFGFVVWKQEEQLRLI